MRGGRDRAAKGGGRKLRLTWLGAFAVLLVAVLGARSWAAHSSTGEAVLTSSPTCSPTGAGGSFCVSSVTPAPLYPGAQPQPLPVMFSNALNVPIYVTSLTVSFTNSFPSGCDPAPFQVSGTALSGSPPAATINFSSPIAVPAASSAGPGQATYNGTLALADNGQNQDSCQGLALALGYSAQARYTVPTSTSMVSSPNPSTDGQSVKLTATVAATVTPVSAGSTPVGNVTFYRCSNSSSSSCTTPLGTAPVSSAGTASINTSFAPTGSYNLEAVYTPTDSTSFSGSSSSIYTHTVGGCAAPPTTGATTTITGTYNGNYEVKSGQSVWLNGGTINGNVTVDSGGQFSATGGTVNGNLQASGPVALQTSLVKGNVQTSTGLFMGPGTTVGGNVQPSGGGPFCSDGTTLSQAPVTINGFLQVQQLTSNAQSSICATIVGKDLQWQQNASPVLLGSCSQSNGPDQVGGNLQVQTNSGAVTIAGNSANGNVQVQNNTGGGTLKGNAAGGNCLLQQDTPGIVGSGNTAKGSPNTCNTGSGGA